MVYRGKVHNQVIILEKGACLPEGLDVVVQTVESPRLPSAYDDSARNLRNGVPVFQRATSATASLDVVNELRDEAL